MGGASWEWEKKGCSPDMFWKPRPCVGTLGIMCHFELKKEEDCPSSWLKHGAIYHRHLGLKCWNKSGCPPAFNSVNNIAETKDGWSLTIHGVARDGSKCKAKYHVSMSRCRGCCCADGLIKYTTQSEIEANAGQHCRDWYQRAIQTYSIFFSTVRMWMIIKHGDRCIADVISKCPIASKLQSVLANKNLGQGRSLVRFVVAAFSGSC